jgi:hypothetical protein
MTVINGKTTDEAKTFKNLTPRPQDEDGLSFSLTKKEGHDHVATTIGILEQAGFCCVVSGNHVAVIPPGGKVALTAWRESYKTADTNPHPYTIMIYDLVY